MGGGSGGLGTAWSNVSRSLGVPYVNSTANAIVGNIGGYASHGTMNLQLSVNGQFAGYVKVAQNNGGGHYYGVGQYIVPPGATYQLDCHQCWGSTITSWTELR